MTLESITAELREQFPEEVIRKAWDQYADYPVNDAYKFGLISAACRRLNAR